MNKKIYVNWKLKRSEHKFYVLDWSYEKLQGYEETEVTKQLIETMTEINNENIDFIGYFKTQTELKQHLLTLAKEEDKNINEFGEIEWDGNGFYVNWGVAGDAPVVCAALDALDVEYDVSCENGNWILWLTGHDSDIYNTVDLKEALMDLLNCEIDSVCEQQIEGEILDVLDRGHFKISTDENGNEESIISDDINNFNLNGTDVVQRVLKNSSTLGRIDPAVLI
jgi:hypothetical protein